MSIHSLTGKSFLSSIVEGVGLLSVVIKALRIILLIWIPIATVVSAIWFMRHEPFEEVVRTGIAILTSVILVSGWITVLRDILEGR